MGMSRSSKPERYQSLRVVESVLVTPTPQDGPGDTDTAQLGRDRQGGTPRFMHEHRRVQRWRRKYPRLSCHEGMLPPRATHQPSYPALSTVEVAVQ